MNPFLFLLVTLPSSKKLLMLSIEVFLLFFSSLFPSLTQNNFPPPSFFLSFLLFSFSSPLPSPSPPPPHPPSIGEAVKIENYTDDPNVVGELLITFFRRVPEPFFPPNCYDDFLKAASIANKKQKVGGDGGGGDGGGGGGGGGWGGGGIVCV